MQLTVFCPTPLPKLRMTNTGKTARYVWQLRHVETGDSCLVPSALARFSRSVQEFFEGGNCIFGFGLRQPLSDEKPVFSESAGYQQGQHTRYRTPSLLRQDSFGLETCSEAA